MAFKMNGWSAFTKKTDDDKKINAVIVNEDEVRKKTIYGPNNGGSCPDPFDPNCPISRKKHAEEFKKVSNPDVKFNPKNKNTPKGQV